MAFRHRHPLVFFDRPGMDFGTPGRNIKFRGGIMSQNSPHLVIGLALIASLGGLLFGYDTAVISGAVSAIDHNFISPRNLPESARDSLSGWAVSCALLGCVIGAVARRPDCQPLGAQGRTDGGGDSVSDRLARLGSPGIRPGTDRRHGGGGAHAVHLLSHPGRCRRRARLDAGAHVHRRDCAAGGPRAPRHLAADRDRGRHHAGLFRELGDCLSGRRGLGTLDRLALDDGFGSGARQLSFCSCCF